MTLKGKPGAPRKPHGASSATAPRMTLRLGSRVLSVSLDAAAEAALLTLTSVWGIPDSTCVKRAMVDAAAQVDGTRLQRELERVVRQRTSKAA